MNILETCEKMLLEYQPGDDDAPVPDLELIRECLQYAIETGEPLPEALLYYLQFHITHLLAGWDSSLFKKEEARKTHPVDEMAERDAVSYILTCKKTGWDKAPVKKICETFGVSRSSVHRWMKKYPDESDSIDKKMLNFSIILWGDTYPFYGPIK